MTVGRTAFSLSSGEKARMVPTFSAATTIQMTVKRSQNFFQSANQKPMRRTAASSSSARLRSAWVCLRALSISSRVTRLSAP